MIYKTNEYKSRGIKRVKTHFSNFDLILINPHAVGT